MSAGPLVVTYKLTERSRAIVAEELGGVAEVCIPVGGVVQEDGRLFVLAEVEAQPSEDARNGGDVPEVAAQGPVVFLVAGRLVQGGCPQWCPKSLGVYTA